ncbi:hypothetical protein R69746_08058 [Paraburkholderia aspalathi]|nr:hypothetical protein R69746_08058 [Paraburkholderia aspalathi]CAE6867266.1 hypothetical protein R75465_08045 [Paraburkholderia aspalathi]
MAVHSLPLKLPPQNLLEPQRYAPSLGSTACVNCVRMEGRLRQCSVELRQSSCSSLLNYKYYQRNSPIRRNKARQLVEQLSVAPSVYRQQTELGGRP